MSDNQADDFAAVMAELEGPADAEPEAPVQNVDQSDEMVDDSSPAEKTDSEALSDAEVEAAKLIEAGDLDAAAKRLGLDPALFKVDRRQFFAMRKGLADAKAKEAQGAKAKADADKLRSDAEGVYGPIIAGFQAGQKGDGARLKAALELAAEMPWERIQQLVANGSRPLDPATAEVMRLRAELAERDRKAQESESATQAKARESAELAKLNGKLKATPLAGVPGAAEEIYALVKASFDGVGYGVSVREAYAKVKAKAEAAAKAFGSKPAAPVKGKEPLRQRAELPARTKLSAAEREAADFARILREAEDATRQRERAARRGAR